MVVVAESGDGACEALAVWLRVTRAVLVTRGLVDSLAEIDDVLVMEGLPEGETVPSEEAVMGDAVMDDDARGDRDTEGLVLEEREDRAVSELDPVTLGVGPVLWLDAAVTLMDGLPDGDIDDDCVRVLTEVDDVVAVRAALRLVICVADMVRVARGLGEPLDELVEDLLTGGLRLGVNGGDSVDVYVAVAETVVVVVACLVPGGGLESVDVAEGLRDGGGDRVTDC